MNFKNPNERAGAIGTIVFHALLLLLVVLLGYCTDLSADELDAGGVTVSLGQPDQGGEDNSTAEQEEEYTPQEEEYTPENQVTSDVEEAPEVKKTTPTPNPKPKTTPTETKPKETPKETKPKRTVDPRSQFPGSKKTGTGSGGGTTGGDKGDPDGKPDGSPDGSGTGNGGGGNIGDGISGGIGGFSVAKKVYPKGGVQEQGVVRLKVCVDANGTVIPSSIKYAPDRDPLTTTNLQLRNRAIDALKQFKFKNTSGSTGGCGYIKFTFKLK